MLLISGSAKNARLDGKHRSTHLQAVSSAKNEIKVSAVARRQLVCAKTHTATKGASHELYAHMTSGSISDMWRLIDVKYSCGMVALRVCARVSA